LLVKKGQLSEKDWLDLKRHSALGFNIAMSSAQTSRIAKLILSCHENWDGSGYPTELSGEAIPLLSRIVAIADAYEVMTSGRAYKGILSKSEAIKELKRCSGTQFDPVLVDKFIAVIKSRRVI
jgi:response regulator RpfG family c-di-GMP phosphodiesterase